MGGAGNVPLLGTKLFDNVFGSKVSLNEDMEGNYLENLHSCTNICILERRI